MSVLWFLILYNAWKRGIEISDMAFLMTSILYVGDCILILSRKMKG